MQAKDASGNLSPYGYTIVKVHNQDDIPPANTVVTKINGEDAPEKWPPLEWKWHKVIVRTYRNVVGHWSFGGGPNCDPLEITDEHVIEDRNSKFFNDIDFVVVEMWDNE
jgi:hypothetical protein